MKFDFCIGNPPYQEEQISENADGSLKNYAPPVYDKFMDAAYEVADKVELIHPARFLFNAGSTPKVWNEKMLNDEHFTVLFAVAQQHNDVVAVLARVQLFERLEPHGPGCAGQCYGCFFHSHSPVR